MQYEQIYFKIADNKRYWKLISDDRYWLWIILVNRFWTIVGSPSSKPSQVIYVSTPCGPWIVYSAHHLSFPSRSYTIQPGCSRSSTTSPPSTEPCMNNLTNPVERVTWPNHRNFLLFMIASWSSCVPTASVISVHTDSFVRCAVYSILSILRKHLYSHACILRYVSDVIVQDLHPYNAVDVVIVSLIFEAVDTFLSLDRKSVV